MTCFKFLSDRINQSKTVKIQPMVKTIVCDFYSI